MNNGLYNLMFKNLFRSLKKCLNYWYVCCLPISDTVFPIVVQNVSFEFLQLNDLEYPFFQPYRYF